MTTRALAPSGALSEAYASKNPAYFSNARADFVYRLPVDPTASILEVGCGTGATGHLALSRGRCGRYVGIELMEAAGAQAREVLSEVVVGDVEKLDLHWPPASFDALILSEVLEHLIEPWKTLGALARLVRPGGLVLASSPNVSHWRVLREVAMGRFPLADQGVFDRTHMRWFTPATFMDLFESAGFRVVEMRPVTPFAPRTELMSKLTGGRFDHLFMTQIAVVAVRR